MFVRAIVSATCKVFALHASESVWAFLRLAELCFTFNKWRLGGGGLVKQKEHSVGRDTHTKKARVSVKCCRRVQKRELEKKEAE